MRPKQFSIITITLIATLMIFSSQDAAAQCKAFVRNSCVPQLRPYIHDGSYQAVMMSQGDEADIYKTIFAGQQYRLFVCADNSFPNVEFVVTDIRRNVLFDSQKSGNVKIWDFKSDVSQQIKITIRIPKSQGSSGAELIYGCVGMLFGLLDN